MMGNGAIALGDSLAPLPWHVRLNLGTEDQYCTSVLVHPRQGEAGLIVFERCYIEYIINSVAYRGRKQLLPSKTEN